MPDHIRLIEPDYDDVRDILEAYRKLERNLHCTMMRGALTNLVLRIGEIYDNARARAIREHLDAAKRIVASAVPEARL